MDSNSVSVRNKVMRFAWNAIIFIFGGSIGTLAASKLGLLLAAIILGGVIVLGCLIYWIATKLSAILSENARLKKQANETEELHRNIEKAKQLNPLIQITNRPNLGDRERLEGRVWAWDVSQYMIVVLIQRRGNWWNKPNNVNKYTKVSENGFWSCDITPAHSDLDATQSMAFLMPASRCNRDSYIVFGESSISPMILNDSFSSDSVGLEAASPEIIEQVRTMQEGE